MSPRPQAASQLRQRASCTASGAGSIALLLLSVPDAAQLARWRDWLAACGSGDITVHADAGAALSPHG